MFLAVLRSRKALSLVWPLLVHSLCGQPAPPPNPARHGVSAVKNPFARTFVLPVEVSTARPIGIHSRVQNAVTFQPVTPFALGSKWDLIVRTIVPVLGQPDLASPSGGAWGISDISPNFYFSPDTPGPLYWGIGPALLLPTASAEAVGTGKWSAGPAGAIFFEPGKWTLGVVASNLKSFAGSASRQDVHFLTLQYQVTRNFWRGWYWTTSPTMAADWTLAQNERWLVPVGLGIGSVFGSGKRQWSGELSAYYTALHPATVPYAIWVVSFRLALAIQRSE